MGLKDQTKVLYVFGDGLRITQNVVDVYQVKWGGQVLESLGNNMNVDWRAIYYTKRHIPERKQPKWGSKRRKGNAVLLHADGVRSSSYI